MRTAFFANVMRHSAKYAKNGSSCAAAGVALTLLPSLTAAGGPTGPNGNTLAHKMVAVYQQATSVQADFEAEILRPGGTEYVQSGTMRYKRPDRVELYTTDPLTGSFHAWADGRGITVYSGKTNSYTKRNAPSGLAATVAGIEKVSEDVLGVRSTQIFSPLSFILTKDMPREAGNFYYLKQDTVAGHKTYCIAAKLNEAFVKDMLQSRSMILVQRDVKLWIDIRTSQLVRSACTIAWKYQIPGANGKKPTYSGNGISFQETYRKVIFDAPIKDDTFRFVPPQGARQLFQERR